MSCMGMSQSAVNDASRPDIHALIPTSARAILVVGCGEGALGHALKQERTVEVSGIEMSPAAAKAREVLDSVYSGNIEVVADKLPAAYYDCIVFADVLERLANPRKVLAQLKRCLKPDGTVVVSTHNSRHWPVLRAILEDKWGRESEGGVATTDRDRLRFFSKAAVTETLKSAGLDVSTVRPIRDPEQPGMPEAIRHAIESELGESTLALTEETQDCGYLMVARPAAAAASRPAALPATTKSVVSNTVRVSARVPQGTSSPSGNPGSTAPRLPSAPKQPAQSAPSAQSAQPAKGAQPSGPVKRKPVASIIILTWNQKDLTEKCLRSLETTTKVPHEVIVVDNGSIDGTGEFLKSYAAERAAAKSDNVRVVLNAENLGVSKGFNQGLKEAKGDYMVLLHNDVVLPSQWLERLLRHFYMDKKAGMVGPRSNTAKPHQFAPLGYRDLGEYPDFAEAFFNRNKGNRTRVDSLGGFCLAVKREVLAKIGLLEETYTIARYEDDDLCMRARLAGSRLVVADDVYVHHAGGASFKQNQVDVAQVAEANRGKFIDRWGLKPKIVYIMRWSAQSSAAQTIFRQINDLVDRDYEVRVVSLEGKPETFELKAEVQRVGAFEMLPPLDDDIVVVCSAQDLPVIAPRCRGKLVHLCLGYESFHYGGAVEDVLADKPQMERYHSIPCVRIVASQHLSALFQERFSQRTLVVPGWLDTVLGGPRPTVWPGVLENANILFVGRPTAAKGFADFTTAVRAVREKYPGTTMRLAVPPRVIASQEKAETLFDGPVVLHAALSRTEMEFLYKSVDVAVFPSWYEGSSIAVLDAMACGTPVVTADSLGIRDVCRDGENALVVPASYPRKLAQAITRVLEDEGLRKRLASEGPKAAAPFTHEESTKALQQAVDTIFRWEVIPPDYRPVTSEAGKRVAQGLTSIVTATLNGLEFTRKCLDALFTYTDNDPFELIVVDNGSTDGTWAYLEDLPRKHQNVRVLRNPYNTGMAYAADQGIFLATGEFVVILHNDTIVTKGWLRRLRRIASSVPGAGLVGPVSNNVSGAQAVDAGDLRTMDQIQGYAGSVAVRTAGQTTEVNRLSGFCLMARREVLDRIGVLDTVFPYSGFEDDDLSIRARLAGFKCLIVQDVFVYHFRGRTFDSNNLDRGRITEQNRRRFLRKWAMLLHGAGATMAGATPWSALADGSIGDDNAPAAPLSGAERLARRIAERAAASQTTAEDVPDHLPPEEMGPLAVPSQAAAANASAADAPVADAVAPRAATASAVAFADAAAAAGPSEDEAPVDEPAGSSLETLHAKANAQFQAGRFIIALALFERILKTHPGDGRARYNAALCSVQTGDTRRARRYLNSLIAHSAPEGPGGPVASTSGIYNLIGVSFIAERDFPAAATCFEKALSLDPANSEAMANLRIAHDKMK